MTTTTRLATALAATAALAAGATFVAARSGDEAPPLPRPPRPASETGTAQHFALRTLATGLDRPTWVGGAPGDGAIWALEQAGRVVRIAGGDATTVLDLGDRVRVGAEQGLLGLAFAPDFARSGRLFLSWTDRRDGASRVAEFTRGGRQRRMLLRVPQPEENHNGGHLAFGPDGRLYLGLGDGGGAFDPRGTAQDPGSRLGKIIATPVDGPPRWRTVVSGLRNPWRFSFDQGLGELWIGDVGQDGAEEVDRVILEPDEPPKNLGWSAYEGTTPIPGRRLDRTGELVWPVAVYDHEKGRCSITGGVVYAGTRLPALARRYVYGDFCAGTIWTLRPTPGGGATDVRRERVRVPQLTHVGTTTGGELLFASASGTLYAAAPARAG